MKTETIRYHCGDLACEGYVAHAREPGSRRPGVLICHAWMGQDDFAREKAEALARLGYVGFAADVYGAGNRATTNEEATALMTPLVEDRGGELKRRLLASLDAMKALDAVDASRVAAIGYCFGGLCAIDIARHGADLRGAVAFHGLLGGLGTTPATVKARVLALHGWDDPMATPDQVQGFAEEMTAAGADWQLHAYGGTMHAFTNPRANDPDFGTVYSQRADVRSWRTMECFLEEVFA